MFVGGEKRNVSRPSFFEVIAQQYFVPSLEPAVDYLFAMFASRSRIASFCCKYNSEVFYSSLASLDAYYLYHYDGTFTENFYSLKRGMAVNEEPLSKKRKVLSLLLTNGIPYIRRKLEDWYEPYANRPLAMGGVEASPAREALYRSPGFRSWLLRQCVTLYPWFSAVFEGFSFLYQLLYLFDRTPFFNPILAIERVTLLRLSPDDEKAQEEISKISRVSVLKYFKSRFARALLLLLFSGMDLAQHVLPVSVFLFRFHEWWYSDENEAMQGSRKEFVVPPPPKRHAPVKAMPKDPRVCPICEKQRTNPAAGPSGYCCCYPCLFKYVKEHRKCPITGVECDVQQLVKIYED